MKNIKENEKLFSKEELEIINNSIKVVKKIYLLAFLDNEI